jgi:23S rRNA pseudouridine2605 synthase
MHGILASMKDSSTLAAGFERLERALAHQGVASRREAKAMIVAGLIKVNGTIIKEPGFGIVLDKDYKPRDIETNKTNTSPSSAKAKLGETKDLHDYFPKFKHLAPIGRLDKDSEGLIIMSNDGSLARALTQENSPIGKTYVVTVRENVTDEAIKKMSIGIMLDKARTRPAVVKRISRSSFSIVLHEGRKHQIRRMADACHLTVESLIRTDIGFMSIGAMKPGSVRKLNDEDVAKLKRA